MQVIEIIGLLAGACTTFSAIPQIKKIIATKSTRDISYLMYLMNCTGNLLWVTYGFFKESESLIIANLISFSLMTTVLILKLIWDKNPHCN